MWKEIGALNHVSGSQEIMVTGDWRRPSEISKDKLPSMKQMPIKTQLTVCPK
jgi:hypothetical protein